MEIKQSEKFESVVNKIFGKLLEVFPEPIALCAEDIGITDELPDEPVETMGGIPVMQQRKIGPEEKFFDHCVDWLAGEEYVASTQKQFGTFGKVVLTEKGLAALNATPQCLNAKFND